MNGIMFIHSLTELLDQAENNWPSLLTRLQNLRGTILSPRTCRDGMFLDLTGDVKVLSTVQPSVKKMLHDLPGDANGEKLPNFYVEEHPWVTQANKERGENVPLVDEGFIVPTQVSYVGKGGLLYDDGEHIHGSTSVVSKFLRTGYLWDQVRVMGGAYGASCALSKGSGFFGFVSYRDPNLAKTIDVYDKTADALMAAADELEKDEEALHAAIIGTIGAIDGALSPDQKGWTQLIRWITNNGSAEGRQQMRDELIGTKPDDFREFARRLKKMTNPTVAVISSKAGFEAAAKDGKHMNLTVVV